MPITFSNLNEYYKWSGRVEAVLSVVLHSCLIERGVAEHAWRFHYSGKEHKEEKSDSHPEILCESPGGTRSVGPSGPGRAEIDVSAPVYDACKN